jgi:hypothetical protein
MSLIFVLFQIGANAKLDMVFWWVARGASLCVTSFKKRKQRCFGNDVEQIMLDLIWAERRIPYFVLENDTIHISRVLYAATCDAAFQLR